MTSLSKEADPLSKVVTEGRRVWTDQRLQGPSSTSVEHIALPP